jgi:cysteinyl-tRNA synthetase
MLYMKFNKDVHGWQVPDSNIAKSMGRVWQVIKSRGINIKTKYKLLRNSDKVSGTKIEEIKSLDEMKPPISKIIEDEIAEEIPEEILELKRERNLARKERDWQKNEELRVEIERGGYIVEDKGSETVIRKRN